MTRPRTLVAALVMTALAVYLGPAARADGGVGSSVLAGGNLVDGGASVFLCVGRPGHGAAPVGSVVVEHQVTPACPGNSPTSLVADNACAEAVQTCPDRGLADAVLVWDWTRQRAGAAWGPWLRLDGGRCTTKPPTAPGLTTADVLRAFRAIRFAPASVTTSPTGVDEAATLVNDPTVFRAATQPTEGRIPPGRTVPVRLLGHAVRIRTAATGHVFVFGDGATAPTTAGPAWHTYVGTGVRPVRADTVVTGRFSVDGAAWRALPGTARVPGVTVPLHVYQAHAVLVDGTCATHPDGPGCPGR